ncbi:MAG: alpha/beta fold hydrolase [Gemmatimonadaceae bacterium]
MKLRLLSGTPFAMLGAALLSSLPSIVLAQAIERATFYLVSQAVGGTDTVVSERVTRTADRLDGEILASTGARSMYAATLSASGLVTRLEMHAYRGAADTTGSTLSFVLGADSIVARVNNGEPAHLPGTMDALAIVNPSVGFIEQMIVRAKAMGGGPGDKAGIPLFIVGSPAIVPLTVTWVGADSALVEYAGVSMRFKVSPTGLILGGVVPAQRLTIDRGAFVEKLLSERPDYRAPAGAPYTAEDVVVTTAAGLKLSGTLTIPRGRVGGRAPAIVTITGSGSEDRDEQPVGALRGYRPFRELADTLGRRGIAVLRLDDRGVNGSDIGSKSATSTDFADDIRAGVAYVRSRPEIDPARVGLVGHSEGGIIAPMVAATDSKLRAIVLMAGSASPGRDILRSQQHYVIDTMLKLTGVQRESALAASQRATDSLAASTPWMKQFIEYDPSVIARTVKTPVLIVHGLTDHQVPASEADKLAAAFRAGGNASVTVRKFPATNHLFIADETGSFDYAKLPSFRVRAEVLSAIADWLGVQFK